MEAMPHRRTTRNTGCRVNPRRGKKKVPIKDYLHPHEMHAIADTHFKDLTGPPASGKLPYEDGDKYDALIRGWTRYWNEVFQPKDPLDPGLIKALIATESGFRLEPPVQNAGAAGNANGLIQLTDQTIRILQDPDGDGSLPRVHAELAKTHPGRGVRLPQRGVHRNRPAGKRVPRCSTQNLDVGQSEDEKGLSFLPPRGMR